jgi:hypothetical protein
MPTIQQLVRFERTVNKKKKQSRQHFNLVHRDGEFVHVFTRQLLKNLIQHYEKLPVFD